MTALLEITPQGKKKLSSDTYNKVIKETVKKLTLKSESECKKEAPKGPTGNLQRGHTSKIGDYEGTVTNKEPYTLWIIWGDGNTHPEGNVYYFKGKPFVSKGVPNNYPQRVVSKLAADKFASRLLHQELKKQGVI